MITRLLTSLLLLPAAAFAAAALPIEFNGVVVEGNKIQVSLLNPNTGSAKWVAIGGKFDNYIVTSCNVLGTTPGGQAIQNPTVILTNAVTKIETPILIKSSVIGTTPTPSPFNGGPGPTMTTVTMGPNGPTVNVGPAPGPGGQPGQPQPNLPANPAPVPTTAPTPPPPGP